ncbi:carotenoid biosynthesis protein [Polaribacter litorisediminis]|uniref:carotenoid biosynthesis protein n=1 Tax=Polaribacter litorisediminis TaxID=1908341 RepID=UPI001CC1A3C8|nr:carotenoid biosynthesis protein [Polaribacter litorisediminis]UAM99429.1 carotenoid biosynthesis protein [Polaribacter litorisediminis]
MIKNISIENRWIILLLLFYFFGLLGMSIVQFRDLFLMFTPLNLLITLLVFYKINNDFSRRFLILSFLVFLIGFSIEAIGVATGVLFGNYAYGAPFGFKLFETPILIGVNWLFLALSAHGIVQSFTKKALWLIILPSLCMTLLDFLVEPVAMKLDFWSWENDSIPIQNYVMWFVTSIFIHSIIYFFSPKINTKVSFFIFGAQLIFFGVLNLVL